MCITWIRYKKPDVSMTLNGSLAGLVAITAGCDMVTPMGAVDHRHLRRLRGCIRHRVCRSEACKVDDPVGAVGVHCINGAMGTILTGLFAYYNGTEANLSACSTAAASTSSASRFSALSQSLHGLRSP